MERLGPYTYEPAEGDSITSDTLLLAGFVPALAPTDRVLEIGTASAPIPLLLAAKNSETRITGVEIQPQRADAAMKNIRANGLDKRITILNMDYRDLPRRFSPASFTHVIANPPYKRAGTGRVGPTPARNLARHETHGTLKDLIGVSAKLLAPRGKILVIFTTERLDELKTELRDNSLVPVREELIRTNKEKQPRRVLMEAVKQGEGRKWTKGECRASCR